MKIRNGTLKSVKLYVGKSKDGTLLFVASVLSVADFQSEISFEDALHKATKYIRRKLI